MGPSDAILLILNLETPQMFRVCKEHIQFFNYSWYTLVYFQVEIIGTYDHAVTDLSLSVSWRSLFPGVGESPQSEGSVFTRLCISHDMTVLLVTSWWRCSAWWSSGVRNISEWGWVGFRPRESVSRWNLLNDDVFMASRFLMPQRQDFCVVEPTVPTIFAFTALRHHRCLDTLLNVCLSLTACSRFCVVLMTIPGGSGWSVTSFSQNSGNFLSWNFWLRGVLI